MRILLTCGGTAGHINPAIAVAQRLRELSPDCEILFIGAEGKMEMDLVPRDGFRILPLKVTNLSRGHHLEDIGHNLNSLKNVIESGREAKRILKEFRPDAVLGTGGYVCYPVLHEAAKLHIPTLIHESNATPGLTTKMLAGQVSCVMLGYQESAGHYSGTADLRVTGTPVRGRFSLYTREKAREELGIPADLPLVVSMWGSLGSGHMNDIVMKMLPLMKGQQDFCMIQVLCRAGASTLSELSSIGKPALIVPSPNVTNHHQEKNARLVENAGGARVLLEGEFDEKSFLEEIRTLLRDADGLERMAKAMRALSVPNALDRIVDAVLEYAGKNRS